MNTRMPLLRILISATFAPLGVFLVGLFATVAAQADDSISRELSFRRDVRPILSNHCFACHGPDEEAREADMRLDVASDVDVEELLARITSTDPDEMMPPPKINKALKPQQIATLTRWIDQGAVHEQHWSFAPLQNHELPQIASTAWSNQPIDQFVLAKLEDQKLQPSPPASKRTLIRRVTLDLTGLPPTRQQIAVFLDDNSDEAYGKLVDQLISSPAYGEQMARYWLDLVRFADTNGLHHDHYREMTPFRDWVIRSYNNNLPMDDFITYQLAGDLFEEPSLDQTIASGFNRLHLIIDRGTALPEESFFRNVVDQVSAVGTVFMGLSMQCAVCHDHKFDPIRQKDFYQLSAFFNNFDGGPETTGGGRINFRRGLQEPFINLGTKQQVEELGRLDAQIVELESQVNHLRTKQRAAAKQKSNIAKADIDGKANSEKDSTLADELKAASAELNKQRNVRNALAMSIPATLVMKERAEVRPAYIMIRGAYDQPGEEVTRDVPAFLPPMKKTAGLRTRMDLAQWFVDPSNPLTSRVAVNRFWQQFFGVGLVKTSEDFGSQGEAPSHPKLLDHLATRFIESGWDVKSLLRSIVLSQTYQQSSTATREQYLADPGNRWLARGSRFRMDAEVVRDQMLAVCGLLNPTMYGKSVKPPQPAGLWKIVTMPSSYPRVYVPDHGKDIVRRSVYTFWKRGLPPPQMTIFDAPTRESCIARRERTNTPLQALLLMNEEQHFAAAMHYAHTLLQQSELTDDERMTTAYEAITAQLPSKQTLGQLQTARQQFLNLYTHDPSAAKAMVAASKDPSIAAISAADKLSELASWTMLVHSLLNLDITKTHE